jgi:anaphase-promoting complex subunit 6
MGTRANLIECCCNVSGLVSPQLALVAVQAERSYLACDFRRCYELTDRVLDVDPFHHACLPIFLACQVELKAVNSLFYKAHQLVDSFVTRAMFFT